MEVSEEPAPTIIRVRSDSSGETNDTSAGGGSMALSLQQTNTSKCKEEWPYKRPLPEDRVNWKKDRTNTSKCKE
jgi:hypothetical protein